MKRNKLLLKLITFNGKTLPPTHLITLISPEGEKPKPSIDSATKKEVKFIEAKSETVNDSVAETVADPFCDESNPRVISFQDVCQAAFVIKGGVDVTPCKVCRKFIFRFTEEKKLHTT